MKRFSNSAAGFSLVEIMVALVIGMVAAIVILQMLALSEQRKRTTTSSGESQSDGVISFYQMARDVGQGGYGFTAQSLFNCNATWKVPLGGAAATAIATAVPLAPVTINSALIPAGDANSDTVLVMYGNSGNQPQGNVIYSEDATTKIYTTQMPASFAPGDRVIALPEAGCNNPPITLDSITATAALNVTVATGAAGVTNGTLYDLGPGPTILAYAVRNGNLTVCDFTLYDCAAAANASDTTKWVSIASNIVILRAQYGRDTLTTAPTVATPPTYAKVDTWDQTTPTGNCAWTRVIAVRFALVARNNQIDTDANLVTAINQNAPVWAGSTGTDADTIDLSATAVAAGATWQNYRYKVIQSVVPIRNVAWMGVPVGC